MKVIVVGAGQVGTYIARTLAAEGHDVVLIEESPAIAEQAEASIDAMVMVGSGTSLATLRAAGGDEVGMVVAVTDSDEANIIACLSARELAVEAPPRTIARVRSGDYYPDDASSAEGTLGIDFMIHPDRVTADDLSEALLVPGAVNVEHFADGQLSVAEIVAQENSPLVGSKLGPRRVTEDYLVAAVGHGGTPAVAMSSTEVKHGDRVFIAARRRQLRSTIASLAGTVETVRHAIVLGGTSIGLQLAKRLRRRGINVKLVERDAQRAERIAAMLDDVLVLHDDGMSQDFMRQEGVEDVHAFIACSDDDAANLLAALNAKKLGAHMTLTVTHRSEFLPLVDAMEVDAAVSPRLHTAAAILRFVRKGRVVRLRQFESGAELIELEAAPGSRIAGRSLNQCDWPQGGVVAGISRDGKVTFPHGDTVIEPGDHVVVFTLARYISRVERLFSE